MIRSFLALALLAASSASAQDVKPSSTYDRAIGAGYKALTLCSARFNIMDTGSQRPIGHIEQTDLAGIYPEYDRLIPSLPAQVGEDRVLVIYDEQMPPRVAIHHGAAGCVIQPIGARPDLDGWMPVVTRHLTAEDLKPVVTPKGSLLKTVGSAFAGAYGSEARTTAVLIRANGRVEGESYAEGFGPLVPQRTWSVAKSLAGTIVGAAVQKKLLNTAHPAKIPEWDQNDDPRSGITLDNLLRMASGLHSATAGNRTDAIYFGGVAVTEETVAWPLEAKPGTRFRYANNDILLAIRSLAATMPDGADFPRDLLFRPLGMNGTTAETDWRGNYILSSQVWSTARDLARFGLLYLNDGVWNGERILPEGWVKYVTTPSGPQPEGEFGYGATFWLMNKSPGVPADTFAAFGNRGQYVVIIPSRKIVIVRRGEDPHGARFDIAKFTADVLAALE